MKTPLKLILSVACAAILFAAPVRAQDNDDGGGGPDSAPPPADAAPNPPPAPPPSAPGGAPNARSGGPGGAGGCPGDSRGGPGDWRGGGPGGPGGGPGGRGGDGRDGVWGRGGPSPDVIAKMKKVEELDGKLWPLAQKVRDAVAEKDKAAAKIDLRAAMEQLFDARLALDEAVQKAHEARAAEMKTSLARHKAQREAIIDKKLTEMVGEDPDDWDY